MKHAFSPYSITQPADEDDTVGIPGGVAWLDFRSTTDKLAGPGQGYAYAVFPDATPLPAGSIALGSSFDNSLSQGIISSIRQELLGGDPLVARNARGIVFELFAHHADITGQARWSTVRPNEQGVIAIRLGGQFTHALAFTQQAYRPATHTLVLDLLQSLYRRVAAAAAAGHLPEHFEDEWLDKQLEHYGRHFNFRYEDLIPSDMPTRPPRPHGTSQDDNFIDSSNVALQDHTPSGTNTSFTWEEVIGVETNIDVIAASNDLRGRDAGVGQYRTSVALADDGHFAQMDYAAATVGSGAAEDGVITNKHATLATESWQEFMAKFSANQLQQRERTAGSSTHLSGSPIANTFTADQVYTLKGVSSLADLHTLFLDAVSKNSVTDTSHQGNLHIGIRMRHSGSTGDNFSGGDNPSGGGARSQVAAVVG